MVKVTCIESAYEHIPQGLAEEACSLGLGQCLQEKEEVIPDPSCRIVLRYPWTNDEKAVGAHAKEFAERCGQHLPILVSTLFGGGLKAKITFLQSEHAAAAAQQQTLPLLGFHPQIKLKPCATARRRRQGEPHRNPGGLSMRTDPKCMGLFFSGYVWTGGYCCCMFICKSTKIV